MNTRAYLRMFGELAENGELPMELYRALLDEIVRDGKMTKRVYAFYIAELERRRLFDVAGTPYTTKNSAKTDGTYKYKHEKNPFWYIGHALTSTLFKFLGYVGGGIVYGVWRVKDRKKLKGIGACVTVSNHIDYLDALLTRRAMGGKKQYIVAAPHNRKNTLGGAILASATIIPLPISLKGARPFAEMLDYVKDRGGAIHFYAEKSMWRGYQKPRPYKEGAFFYAERLGVPIVPMLYCFKKPRGFRKLLGLPKMAIRIADPIYADATLTPRERKKDLCARTQAAARALYEDFYGKPLEYADGSDDGVNILKDQRE